MNLFTQPFVPQTLRKQVGPFGAKPRPLFAGASESARTGRRLGSAAHYCDGLARYHELPQINGYPFHPSEQDMISAAGIKDQELTIIVSMMLIEFAPVVADRINSPARHALQTALWTRPYTALNSAAKMPPNVLGFGESASIPLCGTRRRFAGALVAVHVDKQTDPSPRYLRTGLEIIGARV